MAAELGQQTVDFSTLVGRAAEESFLSLKELVEKSKSTDQSDTEKKINLLKYLSRTQQRMLKLNVLAKWCQQVPLIQYCQQLTSTLSSHATCFTQAADSLFFMHEGLQQARAPAYDVPSAIQVLLTGNYRRLPKCIEDVGAQGVLNHNEQKPVLKKLDTLVRSKLLEISIPKEFSGVKVSDGAVLLRVDGEFKVLVTLGYRGHLSLWRILHLELLVGEKSGPIKLEESRRHVLGDDLERRMAAAENPFATLYSVLNELCVALTMDTVTRQVQGLRRGRWKDAIRFEFVMDGNSSLAGSSSSQLNQDGEVDSASLRTPGLKIMYWLDFGKGSGASDPASCPSIKIEPGPDLQIKCLHSTFVLDPLTGKEAEFSLDQSCIDVEKLLLRAIFCNRYTRLLEIQKELSKNSQICRSVGDVKLQPLVGELDVNYKKKDGKVSAMEYEGQEVLCVRAYGSSFFALGINIRNGRFLLQSSQNILPPSSLSECEEALNQGSMTAAEVFIRLRTNSILNLFSSTGRFLGLKVYEDNSAAVKIPKNVATDSTMLLLGFPDCGTSYFLLMQLDKEFKPQFKLLETRSNLSGKAPSGDNHVTCIKKIDMDEMQLPEDELNFGLLDSGKLQSFLPNAGGLNQSTEHGLLSDVSLEGSGLATVGTTSSFSSVVDEVFDLEKGTSLPPFSVQNFSSSYNASASQYGSNPPNFQSMKTGSPSPKWEGGMQVSQVNKVSGGGRLYPPSNMSGSVRSVTSLSAGSGRPASAKRISTSKSEQDLASLRSPHSAEVGPYPSMDEDQLRFLTDSSKDTLSGNRSYRMLSPPRTTGTRSPAPSGKLSGPRTAPNGSAPGSVKALSSSPWVTTPVSDSAIPLCASQEIVLKGNRISRKRTVTDMLGLIPSLQVLEANTGFHKRRRISDISCTWTQQSSSHLLVSTEAVRTSGFSYGYLLSEANKGNVPSSIYVSALLHVVRHCSLSIKHARLTSQMEALDIPYVEEVGLRNASSNVWFRLPFTRGDSWQYICLRLGRPGTMYWDVKINDQHFRDLWELQKGSGSTPWGSGVRIANTSDVDSHIRYDAEGVVLSYQSVEADSVKKLVADIQRLSNARMFALGMRKLLGVKADDKQEDSTNADSKSPVGSKGVETSDKFSEQMRRVFRIEAVGLMSLWFSFGSGSGSGVLARFVVEWESGKEGCTMHVSPDQLWPHTKFLEDFINGGEVVSLLDCIRLTAGPLHSLAAATRPARATPVTAGPGVAAALSSMSKQGLLSSNVSSNINQSTATPAGNPMLSSGTAPPPGIQNLQGAAMLAAAGRGGPGIVPSSLLPIDVSVVLRGPYWIRIVYRKNFAVDMRCFAGDQVWLQPATPPKGGPSVGGSLPCPQFRPFIMEHVAQELNGIEPSFTGGPQNVVPANSNAPNMGSGQQLSMANGNRVNLSAAAAAISRSGPQVSSLNRVGPAHPGSPNLGAVGPALPIRRSPGAGVPPHVRGELNTAIIGLGDDGGYGGGWVPLVALKKVLRGILKYLGVLWLFAQLPDLLKEILGSILKDNEGALLNLDQEQPALRFFVGGYVFAVSVHRVQLLLQVLSVKRFHQQQQQQQQQQQNSSAAQDELTQAEIGEICDYFSRRVASEPYDASRVASFITLLTLPISVLREFLKLIAWKKGLVQAQGGEIAPAQKPRIELCLENHAGLTDNAENPSLSKSNIHYDRPRSSVDFALTVVLDPAHIPHINAAGGAAWLPYCVSVRLRYSFMENASVSFLRMEGSHGGRACWPSNEEWQKCKQRVARTVEGFSSGGDITQGRLRGVADNVQRTLHLCLQGLRDGGGATASSGAT
ncbi:mediator of RNA polymerase II transcription subunit 14 isoform X3 [Punica granatum]|uniref:Mediator of RNA polymerase II transcription subunit 14 n=1 Tax=Punica granatum TaxID=22663 RepID=A0A6P8CFP5_PUNGR|nr:mediator of RNA polymerase II transcription subunit 14 isoform X3 [Punica granatum]